MKFLSDLKKKDLKGKICLLRIDLNIKDSELDKNNLRIQAILPTIKFLLKNGVKVVLLSHRGRPDHKPQTTNHKLTLRPFVKIFKSLLNQQVYFVDFKKFNKATIANYSIVLLENLRFLKGEEENNNKAAELLASLGDFFVNDAFAVSHRANASVAAITKFMPSYAGLLLEKEIKNLNRAVKDHRNHLIVVLGGAKISGKIGVIKNLMRKADYFLIGGAIANTFVKAEGLPIGVSLYDADKVDFAKGLLKKYGEKIILPADYFISERQIRDIGPNTAKMYSDIIKKAKIIIWNGPMGCFENPKFAKGSKAIAKAIINNKKAFAVIGGGETASLFNDGRFAINDKRLFVSTGGGAMLEYLAGKKLPGIAALNGRASPKILGWKL